jgi:hypothetical protein
MTINDKFQTDKTEASMKTIRLSAHATEQLNFRGATKEEVVEAVASSEWQPAELGRLECKKEYMFEGIWNKKYYRTKQVKLVFVEEENEIVVITVYTYYY